MSSGNGSSGNVTALHGTRGGEADDDARIDAILVDVRALAHRVNQESLALAAHVERESRRGHEHANSLQVLAADVSTTRAEVATLTDRINNQENLHAQRHGAVMRALQDLSSRLAITRAKVVEAQTVAEEARASRPDDGRLDALAADVIAADLERKRAETATNTARANDSIRARAEKRTAWLKWGGQAIGWLTVGGGAVLLAQNCGG